MCTLDWRSPRLLRFFDIAFFLLALSSLIYAVVRATFHGEDLFYLQDRGREWLEGVYQKKGGSFYGHPPYAVVLYSVMAVFSFERWRLLFLVINLLTTVAILVLTKKLFGDDWNWKAQFYLGALLLVWAPFRVTLRMGQISLLITASLLAGLLARSRKKYVCGGIFLGLALSKYSLTLPFFLYFLCKKEWKMVITAVLVMGILTTVFALRLGMSPVDVTRDYVEVMSQTSISNDELFKGATEIGPLLFLLTGGNQRWADYLSLLVIALSLFAMFIVFRRTPDFEEWHLAILALFSLWFVYHNTYDSVLCILPAAFLMNLIIRKKNLAFSIFWLSAMSLFAFSIPGLLTERLQSSRETLSANPAGLLGLHIERLLVFAMFLSFLFALWKDEAVKRDSDGLPKVVLQKAESGGAESEELLPRKKNRHRFPSLERLG
jgi:hypothetical protein